MQQVEKSYVVPVKPDKLVNGALKGMLGKLDPHSDYMTEREYHELMATTSGQFGGVGIEISVEEGVPQVVCGDRGHARLGRRRRAGRPYHQGRRPADRRDGYRRGRPALARQPGDPRRADDRAGQPATFEVPITRAIIHVDRSSRR